MSFKSSKFGKFALIAKLLEMRWWQGSLFATWVGNILALIVGVISIILSQRPDAFDGFNIGAVPPAWVAIVSNWGMPAGIAIVLLLLGRLTHKRRTVSTHITSEQSLFTTQLDSERRSSPPPSRGSIPIETASEAAFAKANDSITIETDHGYHVSITAREKDDRKGVAITVFNNSSQQMGYQVLHIVQAKSFDNHHKAFRTGSAFPTSFQMPDAIDPYCVGSEGWLIWKDAFSKHLSIGVQDERSLKWPEHDLSNVQLWIIVCELEVLVVNSTEGRKSGDFHKSEFNVLCFWNTESDTFRIADPLVAPHTAPPFPP